MLNKVWLFLHLFFAFNFVGSLVVAEWNGRAARAATDWTVRARLFQIVQLSTRVAGFASLLLLGVFGNFLSLGLGYRMASDPWMRWVNGLWVVAVAVMTLVTLPMVGRLVAFAQQAANGGAHSGYEKALARWRFGNVVLSVLYLTLLVFMVFAWRS